MHKFQTELDEMIPTTPFEISALSDEDFFASNSTLQSLLSQVGNIQFTPTCRLSGQEAIAANTQDQFFRSSLRNTNTVPYATAFYQDPFASNNHPATTSEATPTDPTNGPRLLVHKSTLVLALRPGTNGYNGTAHGGLIAASIDEAMGSLIYINHAVHSSLPASRREELKNEVLDMQGLAMFTARMHVRFRAPVVTPGVVLVEATAGKVEGRKVEIGVVVKGESGVVHATCDGMWMSVKREAKL